MKKWYYSFALWPAGNFNFKPQIFEVFGCLKGRIEFEWTEEEFNKTRSELSHIGLVMHEISRVPFTEPEIVL